jgi:methanogenic corrinoid protein MtbC1
MPSPNPFAAELLQASTAAYAAAAARRLLSERPALGERYGRDAVGAWRELLAQRALEVATAVRLGRPELFVGRVEWLRSGFAARHGEIDDLRAGLRALQSTLSDDLPASAREPILACVAAGLEALERSGPDAVPSGLDANDVHGRWALRYLEACLEGRRDAALAVITREAPRDLSIADVYLRVVLPAQAELGRMWHAGEISIAEEHIVSDTTTEALTLLVASAPPAEPVDRTVLTASVAGNAHDIGIRAVSDFFRMAGWRCIALGTNLPPEEIARAALSFEADLCALSVTLVTQLEPLGETIAALRLHAPRTRVLVGGQAFDAAPDLWRDVGADAYAARPDEAVRTAAALLEAIQSG